MRSFLVRAELQTGDWISKSASMCTIEASSDSLRSRYLSEGLPREERWDMLHLWRESDRRLGQSDPQTKSTPSGQHLQYTNHGRGETRGHLFEGCDHGHPSYPRITLSALF